MTAVAITPNLFVGDTEPAVSGEYTLVRHWEDAISILMDRGLTLEDARARVDAIRRVDAKNQLFVAGPGQTI